MYRQLTFTALILLFATATSYGQTVEDFSLPDVNSGSMFTLSNQSTQKGVVLIYMSNKCPFAVAYLDRIRQMNEDYPQITFALINPFTSSSESMVQMKTTWQNWDIQMPYLADKDQFTTSMFKVEKSPTVVILKPIGAGFSIYYIGQIDNNPQIASDVKEAYLIDNLESLLANRPPKHSNNQSVGCTIR